MHGRPTMYLYIYTYVQIHEFIISLDALCKYMYIYM